MSDYSRKRDAEKAARAKNIRQQYAEVNALYQAKLAQGMTQAQAATSQAGDAELAQSIGLPGYRNYTVKSGDDVNTIAGALNTTPQALLQVNPDVNTIQTGMVLQAPRPSQPGGLVPGSEAFRIGQQTGQVQGPPKPVGYGQVQGPPKPPNYPGLGGLSPVPLTGQNPYMHYIPNRIQGPHIPQTGHGQAPANPSGRNVQGGNPLNALPQNTYAAQAMQQNQGGFINGQNPYARYGLNTGYEKDLVAERFMQQAMGQGMTPSNEVTRFLELNGYIRKTKNVRPTPAYVNYSGGNYGGGGSGRGGGGGSVSRGSGGYQQPQSSIPAFSTGAGFRGLTNWRI